MNKTTNNWCWGLLVMLLFNMHSTLASLYTVSNLSDAGAGSLRQAIIDANGNTGLDTIQFSVNGTINLSSGLTSITDTLLIDGFSAPSYSVGHPSLIIDGNGAAAVMEVSNSKGSILRGLSFIDGQIAVRLSTADSVEVSGCWFGLNNTGNASGGNFTTNINLTNSDFNTIGGTSLASRNVVALASSEGIKIESGSDTNFISGNYIGIGKDGSTALGNNIGILIDNSNGNTIGGASYSTRNIITSSSLYGVRMENNSLYTVVKGNFVGIAADGKTNRGNGNHGISYISGSNFGVVGGPSDQERNVSGGNGRNGITFEDCDGHTIENNYSGVDSTGNAAIPNGWSGVSFTRSDENLIQDNVFSENDNEGVYILDSDSLNFFGNIVGLGADGLTALGNGKSGIEINNSTRVQIGEANYESRNIICENNWDGIHFINSDNGVVIGNFIGIAADGVTDRGNNSEGIKFSSGSDNGIIGGPSDPERNVVGGNGSNGLLIDGSSNMTIENNFSGTDSTGLIAVGNGQSGMAMPYTSGSTIQDNIFSGNTNEGIWAQQADNNVFYRNKIGLGLDDSDLGNGSNGIQFTNSSNSNTLGGSEVNANTIAYNGSDGVSIRDGSSNNNLITFNTIFCNTNEGIELTGGSQSSIGIPTITSSGINTTSGLGTTGNTVHVYKNRTAGTDCNCEGEIYLGSAVVDGSGNWTLTHNENMHPSRALTVTATQTDGSNNTSEFSACSSIPLPVEFMNVSARHIEGGIAISWTTLMEQGNDYFEIQRSINGEDFTTIETVQGAGYSRSATSYEINDRDIHFSGVIYYRILQVDFDGSFSTSQTITIAFDVNQLSIGPVPTTKNNGLSLFGVTTEMGYRIIDMIGRELQHGITTDFHIRFNDAIHPGHYYVELQVLETLEIKQLMFVVQ